MRGFVLQRVCAGRALGAALIGGAMLWGVTSCSTAPTAFVVRGPGVSGNEPPTLTISEPNANASIDQGSNLLIRWEDTDRDSNALISFALVNTATNSAIPLVDNIEENDTTGPAQITISTALLPVGDYNLLGAIDDGVNPPVTSYAETRGSITQRVILKIVEPGQGPQGNPPTVTVTEPRFNLSVAQDDVIHIVVQPTPLPEDAARPFDRDSNITLYVLLDLDQDPNNDDPANPDPSKIILLRQPQPVTEMSFAAITFDILIDLSLVPPRPNGEPYFIRATVDDSRNPRVHQYAVGTINVVQLAAGTIDLFDVGRSISGARIYGFNPGANLGSSMSGIGDFDGDGVADFVLVAQFGNPRNFGLVGEAYGIYGLNRIRFGGALSVNSVSETISGVVFEAPPVRTRQIPNSNARTDGITDVSFIRDLSGDGRPDILFGLPHVHGAVDSTDYDPADSDPSLFGCYPDGIVNNVTNPDLDPFRDDIYFYGGGMAVIVNSQNRDNSGLINGDRLESTVVALELAGAKTGLTLGSGDLDATGGIFARADNALADPLVGEPEQAGRVSGARFIGGGYDWLDPFRLRQPPREDLFGQNVGSLGDLNNDGVDEIIISAPRNELYVRELQEITGRNTHLGSTIYTGSIVVLPGQNYNDVFWRDKADEANATSIVPALDQQRFPPFGSCTPPNLVPRGYVFPADAFQVFAEDATDMLGGASSARDFNQDGIDDILCGAPFNDRNASLKDTGAVYILYGSNVLGDYQLDNANDPFLRPPMLRVRGSSPGDRIGWRQTSALDVNGDRIDDVLISSPEADFGGIRRGQCAADLNGDGVINGRDLDSAAFTSCQTTGATEVFADDACKAFDYNNNGRIDDEDEPVFRCLLRGGTDCCANLVNNGFVGVLFGGVFVDGDRTITQIATSDLPGTVFYGSGVGHRAGTDVSSAGDFNQDGFGDILIAVPGETRLDKASRERQGVVYLIFGGTHLSGRSWNLAQVGSADLPGIVFLSPYVKGRPNEAAPIKVAFIGDINNDGFGDIAIGNPMADFIDPSFPQGPDATDASVGRRRNAGDVYVVYGNNFGSNRDIP